MNLTFHTQPFDIPDEFKITLWRFNRGGMSPFSPRSPKDLGNAKWDINAEAVSADDAGIYCVPEEQVLTYSNPFMSLAFFAVPDVTFLKIEADKRDVLYIDAEEVAIAKGNIIGAFDREGFGKRFPIFSYIYGITITGGGFFEELRACGEMGKHSKQMERAGEGVFSRADGFPHSVRVEKGIHLLGGKLGIGAKERESVKDFAYWHDVMRAHGTPDPAHGKRAAEAIERAKGRNKFKKVDTDRLIFACEHHSTMLRSDDPLIDICFDADRLDLTMIGINPDPAMMATEIGSYYAENYEEYLREIKNISI